MAKMICRIGVFWVRAIEEPTFHKKMRGLWVTAEAISKNMGSLVDSSAENKGSLEPYIGVTSIMKVPPPPGLELWFTHFWPVCTKELDRV